MIKRDWIGDEGERQAKQRQKESLQRRISKGFYEASVGLKKNVDNYVQF